MDEIYVSRIQRLRHAFKEFHVDALLVSKSENIFYLSGFRGDDSFLFVTGRGLHVITDSRYEDELKSSGLAAKLHIRSQAQSVTDIINEIVKDRKIAAIGFEPVHVSYSEHWHLKQHIKRTLKPCFRIIERLRTVKDGSEILRIRQAIKIAEKSLKRVVTCGFTECCTEKECADFLEYTMKKEGAEGIAFPSIVASGARSAFPHAVSSKRRIKDNNVLLIDFGAKKGGYCSDLTRTVFLGKITPRFKDLYRIVHEGQEIAIRAIKEGAIIGAVDAKVRAFFKKHAVDQYFTHSLGHGLGLEIHEGPSLHSKNNDCFIENMVVTVEPGLYIAGWGGIRIEDVVLVTKTGCTRLSHYPYVDFERET